MWHLIPTILYITCGEAHQPGPGGYPMAAPNTVPPTSNVPLRQYPDYRAVSRPLTYNHPPQRLVQNVNDRYYVNGPATYNNRAGHYFGNNLRQSKSQSQPGKHFSSTILSIPSYPFDLYNDASDANTDKHPETVLDGASYYANLELVDNFGSYLKNHTHISSESLQDAGHQYNALLSALLALAVFLKNSCTDFDEAYDVAYLRTVESNFKTALSTADSFARVIEDHIRFGNEHIPKLRKLERELCQKKDQSCAVKFDNKIKSSTLWYVKELETLQALAHLARNFYPYIEEFDQAAETREILSYLRNSKDRLKVYVKHMVNSLEHVYDHAWCQ